MLRLGIAVVLCCDVAWTGLVTLNVAFPSHGVKGRYDVIVSLAPGEFRLPTALELYDSGKVAENLAISCIADDAELGDELYPRLELQTNVCASNTDPHVHCFEPTEDSTLGEALSLRQLLVAYGWTRVLVVTDRPHAFRARYVFDRCLPRGPTVDVEVSPTHLTREEWGAEVVYENAAVIKAIFETVLKCG
ncbi:ElyC/SanA/YdcF family protein [Gulosibacter sediminis]|uniref:ElyC/SanA/YdcF family protein n=1 Tax=Gulosibacter sediminis TaxID=1729695 RepID=UPI0024A9E4F5|nr:ElyC/SanA/YdcF family protein [Gulosibacter sediminis]